VLAIATRTFELHEADEDLNTDQKLEACRRELRLVVPIASIDSDRDGVPDSVARGAGIRVVMITGDYLKTALAIARNVTILQPQDHVQHPSVDCARLRPDGNYLSNEQLDLLPSSTRVFARAKLEDKLEIVQSLLRQGRSRQ